MQYALAARGWTIAPWEETAQMDKDKELGTGLCSTVVECGDSVSVLLSFIFFGVFL